MSEEKTAVEKPKDGTPKAFFRREYEFGDSKIRFYLRKMRVSELREATQKFSDIDDALSQIETEEAENDVYVEILTGFAEGRETKNELQQKLAAPNEDDGWILREVWNDYQIAHRPKKTSL